MIGGYVQLYGCVIVRITERAVYVRYEEQYYWWPKSQIHAPDGLKSGPESVMVEITRWLAREKGIVRF